MHCPECKSSGRLWYRSIKGEFCFRYCRECGLIFRDPPLWQVIDYSTYGKKQPKAEWAIQGPGAEARASYLHKKLHAGLRHAGTTLEGKRFLEIGCGPGILLNRLATENPTAELFGLDPTENHAPVEGYTRLRGTLEDADVEPESFDVIAMFGNFMLHKSPSRSLAIIAKALKPGGVLIFDYKNPRSLSRLVVRWARPLLPLSRGLGRRIERQAFHGINFAPMDSSTLLAACGLDVESVWTTHSLGTESATGAMSRVVKFVDTLGGQKAWVDVVARNPTSLHP